MHKPWVLLPVTTVTTENQGSVNDWRANSPNQLMHTKLWTIGIEGRPSPYLLWQFRGSWTAAWLPWGCGRPVGEVLAGCDTASPGKSFLLQGSILRLKLSNKLYCEVNCDKKKYLRLDLSLTPALPGTNLSVPSLVYFSFKVNVLHLTWLKLIK